MINHLTIGSGVGNLSDEVVLSRTQGEPWLFVALIDRYQVRFLNEIHSIVPDEDEAKEVVRETFGKIYMNADRFEACSYSNFYLWANSILMSSALAHQHTRDRV